MTGKILAGKYKIIDVVGKGGMGIVYRAEGQQTDGYLVFMKKHINL